MIAEYLFDLHLYKDNDDFGVSIVWRRRLWTAGMYLALVLGIFCRQVVTTTPTVSLRPENIRPSIAIASAIIALVIAPYVLRKISTLTQEKPSGAHLAWCVTCGFFSDLILTALSSLIKHVFGGS